MALRRVEWPARFSQCLPRAAAPASFPLSLARAASAEASGKQPSTIKTALRSYALLDDPKLNKGASFSREERQAFGLESLLPYEVASLETQIMRVEHQLAQRGDDDLAKHTFLMSLRQQNQVLFYAVLYKNMEKLLGIIYTPTVGEAIQKYSHLFRRPEGVYISYPERERMAENLAEHGTNEDMDLIIVTDSEGILGIGDQGVGGISICLGKGAIYTLGSGVDPNRFLPVVLDAGTDNQELLDDPLYTGWRNKRIRGSKYDHFVDKFVQTIAKQYPNAFLHFEDFGTANAQRLLAKYQDSVSCFNDDIQGTGAAVLSAVLSACKVTGVPLAEQRVVTFGAGTAGLGVTERLHSAMVTGGLSSEEAAKRFWLVDRYGLLLNSEKGLRPGQELFARDDAEDSYDLLETIKRSKATILIGTSTKTGAFNEEIVKAMCQNTDRPIILPLSNPTRLIEAKPQDVYDWSDGKALIATGSPFKPIQTKDGGTIDVAECNNAVIYPGLGLGVILSRAKRLSDAMIAAASDALASMSPARDDPSKGLLPDIWEVRQMSIKVAAAVMQQAKKEGSAVAEIEDDTEAQRQAILKEYAELIPK